MAQPSLLESRSTNFYEYSMTSELPKKKYSVLVVDDQKSWRELLSDILEKQFEVVGVAGYDEALEAIRKQSPPFHVVVTDMRLKDQEKGNEDGLELINYLNQRLDFTKSILVTGYPTIESAKRALSKLIAFDYLEKHPSDGSRFDPQEFIRIIYNAAQEAENSRPDGLSDMGTNILLLEPDSHSREYLQETLRKDKYQVTSLQMAENLETELGGYGQEYALILLSEMLSNPQTHAALKHLCPNAEIVILTTMEISPLLEVMQANHAAYVLPVKKNDEFLEFVHRKLSAGRIKYVSAQISSGDKPIQPLKDGAVLELGITYTVELSLQDKPTQDGNTQKILLDLRGQEKGNIRLNVFIHSEHMRLFPGAEISWVISASGNRPRSLGFQITPQQLGEKDAFIEIKQDYDQPVQMNWKLMVVNS